MSSSSGEIAIVSSSNGNITCYDVASGNIIARFNGSQSPRKGLAMVANNLIAASHISSDTIKGSIHLYNWWASTPIHHIPLPEPVGPLASSSDGSYLFSGGVSGQVHVVSVPSGDIIRSFSAHPNAVSCLALNSDESLLFSGGDDGTIAVFAVYRLVDTSTQGLSQLLMHRFIGHESTVNSIAIGIGSSTCTIISCSIDCTCKFWSLFTGTHLLSVAFPCAIWEVVMDPTESEFFAAGSDGLVYNGQLKKPKEDKKGPELLSWGEHKGGPPVVALSAVNWGRNLVTASETGTILLWDVSQKQVVRVLGEETGGGGGISEVIVVAAAGLGDMRNNGSRAAGGDGNWGLGFAARELSKPVAEAVEIEKMMGVVTHDKNTAMDTLGSAMASYEKLLELILKETEKSKHHL